MYEESSLINFQWKKIIESPFENFFIFLARVKSENINI